MLVPRTTRARPRALARRLAVAAAIAAALGPARALQAQQGGDGFLFGPPDVTLALRGGFDRATAGGDLFGDATRQLTLSRASFSGGTFAADLGVRVGSRAEVVFGSGFSGSSTPSHFRHFTDTDGREVEQTTAYRRVPVTASLRAYLTPRGRSIGRLVWIPARVAPYVGVGGGALYYSFRQTGDFVDYRTKDIFSDDLASTGWAPTAHGFVGLDYALSPHVALTGEARYTWARGTVGGDFAGYDRAGLGGVAATAGLSFRF